MMTWLFSFHDKSGEFNSTSLVGDMQERIIGYFNNYKMFYNNFLHYISFLPFFFLEVPTTNLLFDKFQVCNFV